jgi:hypothetical protein
VREWLAKFSEMPEYASVPEKFNRLLQGGVRPTF